MKTHLVPCIRITALTMILFGVIYPSLITGIAYIIADNNGEGAILKKEGKTIGFKVIGQSFHSDKYFNGRPSAVGYNAAASGGSNKGPDNPDFLTQVSDRIKNFLSRNPEIKKEEIPVDLVTASGSGLDPHISPEAAMIQVPRIANIRGLKAESLRELIRKNTDRPVFGFFGTSKVNVLLLNEALDNCCPAP